MAIRYMLPAMMDLYEGDRKFKKRFCRDCSLNKEKFCTLHLVPTKSNDHCYEEVKND